MARKRLDQPPTICQIVCSDMSDPSSLKVNTFDIYPFSNKDRADQKNESTFYSGLQNKENKLNVIFVLHNYEKRMILKKLRLAQKLINNF